MNTIPKIRKTHWLAALKYYENASSYTDMDVCNKAIEIALAEQRARPESNLKFDGKLPQPEKFITAAQARELGVWNAEWFNEFTEKWVVCANCCGYNEFQGNGSKFKYRAIKKAQPAPVDLSGVNGVNRKFEIKPETAEEQLYCMVSKDGEPAIRMLRTGAQELQRQLGDTLEWETLVGYRDSSVCRFDSKGIYNYKTKATIKLDGKMVTPEQAKAEWEAKKDTHDVYGIGDDGKFRFLYIPNWWAWDEVDKHQYELRPKELKIVKWSDVPVGVMTNRGGFLKGDTRFSQILTTFSPFCVSDIKSETLFLAPADKQPWIAVQDGIDCHDLMRNLSAKGFTYVFCAMRYRIIGLQDGWKMEGDV